MAEDAISTSKSMVSPHSIQCFVVAETASCGPRQRVRERYGRQHLIRFGRSGQHQGGIDGLDQQNPSLVWQTTLQRDRVKAKIELDIALLDEEGSFHPEVFVFVLGFQRDANLQRDVQKISGQRQIDGKCRIDTLFWDDVKQILVGNRALFVKHFIGFDTDGSGKKDPTESELQQIELVNTPDLHLRWGEGNVTGTESESRKLEIVNTGVCNVQILSIELQWHVETSLEQRSHKFAIRDDILTPGQTSSITLGVSFGDASVACVEAGLPKPKIIQEVPLVAKAIVAAVSRPAKIDKMFEVRFERVVNRGREVVDGPVTVRKEILKRCYELYMSEGPNCWVIWKLGTAEDRAELKALHREAVWLRDHGLIEAWLASDMTIVQVRLTTDGRDYVEGTAS